MGEIWLGFRGSGDIKSRVLQIGILLEDEWRQGEWNRAIELVHVLFDLAKYYY